MALKSGTFEMGQIGVAAKKATQTERLGEGLEHLLSRLTDINAKFHTKLDALVGLEPPSEVNAVSPAPDTAIGRLHHLTDELNGAANRLDEAVERLNDL